MAVRMAVAWWMRGVMLASRWLVGDAGGGTEGDVGEGDSDGGEKDARLERDVARTW